MKKIILALAVVCFLAGNVWADEFVFRNGIKWGMGKADIAKSEQKEPLDNRDFFIIYDAESLLQMDAAALLYSFTNDDHLVLATYIYEVTYPMARYMEIYDTVKTMLSKKYGKPKTDEIAWLGDGSAQQRHKDNLAFAIDAGMAVIISTWETEDTIIETQMMEGSELKPFLYIKYCSKKYNQQFSTETQERQDAVNNAMF